ncbi:MAG: ankyrin repeat domain-containing protein [Pseudomonadales bacterium]|nr:ankyrin repeat domain-containing protein [Pseudomonadales bacterium]NRA17188.1 ankyrin repeat domain-containing protein [Oceanospirillaceae bacterium]
MRIKRISIFIACVLYFITGCATLSEYTIAARAGDAPAVSEFLIKGQLVDEKDSLNNTALYWAASMGHEKVISLLLDAGANINKTNGQTKETAIDVAAENGHFAIVKELLQAGAKPGNAIVYAVKQNQIDTVTYLLDSGVNPNLKFPNSVSLLTLAAGQESSAMLLVLLKAGALPNDKNGQSPALIQTLSKSGIEALLAAGANPDTQTSSNLSPLYVAITKRQPEILKLLLAAGAKVNTLNGANNETALLKAIKDHNQTAVKQLLAAGADSNIANKYGVTPLFRAINDLPMVKLLLASGADIHAKVTSKQRTALHEAIAKGNIEVIRLLLAAGAKPNVYSLAGKTPLHLASQYTVGNAYMVKLLVTAGANVNLQETSENKYIPLYLAANNGNYSQVDQLLKLGANPNVMAYNQFRTTPVFQAAWKGHYQVVERLLKSGANPNLRDPDYSSESSLDIADALGFEQIKSLIANYGGKSASSGDSGSFGKIFASVAIGAVISGSNIPVEAGMDIAINAANDIWVENGNGDNLTNRFKALSEGGNAISDPVLRELFQTRLEIKNQQQNILNEQKKVHAQQQQQQQEMATKQAKYIEAQRNVQQTNQLASTANQQKADISRLSSNATKKNNRSKIDLIRVEAVAYCYQTNSRGAWGCDGPIQHLTISDQPTIGAALSMVGCGNTKLNRNRKFSSHKLRNPEKFKNGVLVYCGRGLERYDRDIATIHAISSVDRKSRNTYKCGKNTVKTCTILHQQSKGLVKNFNEIIVAIAVN